MLNKPYSLTERQATELESILTEFPYLQSARAIYLKGLYNKDSFRYNTELKKTAAYTTDRSVLFDFITSEEFRSIDKNTLEEQERRISEITVHEPETAETLKLAQPIDKLEESIKLSIKEAEPEVEEILQNNVQISTESGISAAVEPEIITPATVEETLSEIQPEETLQETVGRPLPFNDGEKHSFAEWLQLSKLTPVKREALPQEPKTESLLDKKLQMIDRFIEANPKIAPVKNTPITPANIEKIALDGPGLMTETLARVYLEQKKYSKAIQAYEILILKYPEKSVFFANRILEIKNLQQNNN